MWSGCSSLRFCFAVFTTHVPHQRVSGCAASVIVCFVEDLHANAPVRAGLVRTLRLLCREVAVSSTSTLAIDVRLSDIAASPLLHGCCCIISPGLQQAIVFRAVRLLFAAQVFCDVPSRFAKGVNQDCIFSFSKMDLVCVLLIAWFPVVPKR